MARQGAPSREWAIWVVMAVGFLLRLHRAATTYLNADEASNALLLAASGFADSLRSAASNPHPPLFFLVASVFVAVLGESDLVYRLPSLLAGTATCWFSYRWAELVAGKTAGLILALLVSLCFPLTILSSEVRDYALMLMLLVCSLYALELGLRRESARALLVSGICQGLAVGTTYSAILAAPAMGVYALGRLYLARNRRRLLLGWATGQLVALGCCLHLYFAHIRVLRGGIAEQGAMNDWLREWYFQPGQHTPYHFALRNTWRVLLYLFGSPLGAGLGVLLFLAALLALGAGLLRDQSGKGRLTAFLLAGPLLTACAAALLRVHPYGGSRHSVFVVFFVFLGVAVVLAKLSAGRERLLAAGAFIFLPVWHLTADPMGWYVAPPNQDRRLVVEAVDYLLGSAPRGSFIFTSHESGIILSYYLGKEPNMVSNMSGGFYVTAQKGYRLIGAGPWWLSADDFLKWYPLARVQFGIPPTAPVWVFDACEGPNLGYSLPSRFPGLKLQGLKTFGANVSVFRGPALGDLPAGK